MFVALRRDLNLEVSCDEDVLDRANSLGGSYTIWVGPLNNLKAGKRNSLCLRLKFGDLARYRPIKIQFADGREMFVGHGCWKCRSYIILLHWSRGTTTMINSENIALILQSRMWGGGLIMGSNSESGPSWGVGVNAPENLYACQWHCDSWRCLSVDLKWSIPSCIPSSWRTAYLIVTTHVSVNSGRI